MAKKNYILELRSKGIKVINFEDLGAGARYSDLTINELFLPYWEFVQGYYRKHGRPRVEVQV
mgnify:CR=1 FL=1